MAKGDWSGEKVENLVEAIKSKNYDEIDRAVIVDGNGSFPEKAYGRGWKKFGPSSILAASIETDDLEIFDHLIELGMKTVELNADNGVFPGTDVEVLFGKVSSSGNNLRNPEILVRLVQNGFDFSSVNSSSADVLRAFVIENADNLGLFQMLEDAGLRYWTCAHFGDPEQFSDESYIRWGWRLHESIPWEVFLCEGRFGILEHFISKGYKPVRPLRLQVGTSERDDNQQSAVKSRDTIDFICKNGLPTYGIVIMEDMTDEDIELMKYSIERGIKPYNPEKLFATLDYGLIKTALQFRASDMKREYVGPAKAAGRDDLLRLYGEYGVSSNDATSQIVDDLLERLKYAEYGSSSWNYRSGILLENPKRLRLIDAIEHDESADWQRVTRLLARLYCASFDNFRIFESVRASCLDAFADGKSWPSIFEYCLSRFKGNLDIRLIVPMFKVTEEGFGGDEKGFGKSFWYEPDVAVYKILASRGVKFLCKIRGTGGFDWDSKNLNKNQDALPGDVFIWLAPDVSEFLFDVYGWKKERLEVSHSWRHKRKHGYDLLPKLLIGSGNEVAYKWFVDNASKLEDFKKPAVKDVVGSPLLRPYLESKKDGSVRSKDNVTFIMETLQGEFKEDTLLFIKKAALDEDSVRDLKNKLQEVESDERKVIAQEAIALLDDASSKPKTRKKQSGEKKLTVPQLVTLVADALDEKDESKLAELEPIAPKVPMVDCVELLEHAAAKCSGAAIDKLYELFAPFECASTALNVALFSGNLDSAKALVAHGADLAGNLRMIDEKRTPSAKRGTREKRYSHGLMSSKYSSGGPLARNLPEALTKWDGSIESRSKKGAYGGKRIVNETSNDKAADTLLLVSAEAGFDKSIAIRLLWNFISFDGRQTCDACFDAENSRKILEAGILSDADISVLPWTKVSIELFAEDLELIRDFASEEDFLKCWRPGYAKPSSLTNEYYVESLLVFVDFLTTDVCSNQLDVLKALVATGNLESLKKLACKPGWFTKQRTKNLIDFASEFNQTEITAWLLELSNEG